MNHTEIAASASVSPTLRCDSAGSPISLSEMSTTLPYLPAFTDGEPFSVSETNRLAVLVQRGLAEQRNPNGGDPALIEAGHRARNQLIEANLRLVVHQAKRYFGPVPLEDLVGEGVLGLMKAVEKYDPVLGYHLSTYAVWWIRQAISNARSEQGTMMCVPRHMHEKWQKYRRTRQRLALEWGRDPSEEEVCLASGVRPDELTLLRRSIAHPRSLDKPATDDLEDGEMLGDILPDEDGESTEEQAHRTVRREALEAAMARILTSREQRIVMCLQRNDTLAVVAREFGISRERVRQIEAVAHKKLRCDPAVRALAASC